jgi:hypothetical protein
MAKEIIPPTQKTNKPKTAPFNTDRTGFTDRTVPSELPKGKKSKKKGPNTSIFREVR